MPGAPRRRSGRVAAVLSCRHHRESLDGSWTGPTRRRETDEASALTRSLSAWDVIARGSALNRTRLLRRLESEPPPPPRSAQAAHHPTGLTARLLRGGWYAGEREAETPAGPIQLALPADRVMQGHRGLAEAPRRTACQGSMSIASRRCSGRSRRRSGISWDRHSVGHGDAHVDVEAVLCRLARIGPRQHVSVVGPRHVTRDPFRRTDQGNPVVVAEERHGSRIEHLVLHRLTNRRHHSQRCEGRAVRRVRGERADGGAAGCGGGSVPDGRCTE